MTANRSVFLMHFELIPHAGVELPFGYGKLEFGMTQEAVRHVAARFGVLRPTWVCGTAWSLRVEAGDRRIDVLGHEADESVTEFWISRLSTYPWGAPAGLSVTYRGIDLFGYPLAEIEEALGPAAGHRFGLIEYPQSGLKLGTFIPQAPAPPPQFATEAILEAT